MWRAHVGPWLTAAGLLLAAAAGWAAQTWVPVPFTMVSVPARVLLVIVATTLYVQTLGSVVGVLENTVPRARQMRFARAAAGLALLVAPMCLLWAWRLPWELWRPELALALLLVTGGTLTVMRWGALAWVTPVAAGLLAIVIDHADGQPLTTALSMVPMPLLAPVAAGALVLFTWRNTSEG